MKKTTNTFKRTQYMERCKICKREIKGFSESQVKYNLEVHVKQKHDTENKSNAKVNQ